MKPHVHAELIKAWADGAQIQYYDHDLGWSDLMRPSWHHEIRLSSLLKYRIKPREFENDAFYPVMDEIGDKEVAWHSFGNFYMVGDARSYKESYFKWIGPKLDIDWPEE